MEYIIYAAQTAKTVSLLGEVRTEMYHKTVWKNMMHLFKIISLMLQVSNTFCAIFSQIGYLDWDKINVLKFSQMWEISSAVFNFIVANGLKGNGLHAWNFLEKWLVSTRM